MSGEVRIRRDVIAQALVVTHVDVINGAEFLALGNPAPVAVIPWDLADPRVAQWLAGLQTVDECRAAIAGMGNSRGERG